MNTILEMVPIFSATDPKRFDSDPDPTFNMHSVKFFKIFNTRYLGSKREIHSYVSTIQFYFTENSTSTCLCLQNTT